MGVIDSRRKEVGRIGEQIATDFLVRKGFSIIARNFRRPWGEIDIIAEKAGSVRFVEVKTLTVKALPDVSCETNTYRPEEQVHPLKLRKLARTAEFYMSSEKDSREFQIDVVGVFLDMESRKAKCRLFEQVL